MGKKRWRTRDEKGGERRGKGGGGSEGGFVENVIT